MALILTGGLPRMGICRNIARVLVYGLMKHQGFIINKLHTTQGITHFHAILDHTWKVTDTGKLITITMEQAKMESGINDSLFVLGFDIQGFFCKYI